MESSGTGGAAKSSKEETDRSGMRTEKRPRRQGLEGSGSEMASRRRRVAVATRTTSCSTFLGAGESDRVGEIRIMTEIPKRRVMNVSSRIVSLAKVA